MSEVYYDLTKPNSGVNYRWIQPPQIGYFITTIDSEGNPNTTPATLGTCVSVDMEPDACGNFYLSFSVGYSDLPHVPARHGYSNLMEIPECVISYIGSHLLNQAQVGCLPLPKGVSELDVAGLTELPSKKVRPPGIREAKLNIECEIVSTHRIGQFYQHFIAKAVGLSVEEGLLELDRQSDIHAGVFNLDPLFEIAVLPGPDGRPPRLCFIKLDKESFQRLPDSFGPTRTFVGKFDDWIEDEVNRGSLSEAESKKIVKLNREWQDDLSPTRNGEAKAELTRMLRDLVAPHL